MTASQRSRTSVSRRTLRLRMIVGEVERGHGAQSIGVARAGTNRRLRWQSRAAVGLALAAPRRHICRADRTSPCPRQPLPPSPSTAWSSATRPRPRSTASRFALPRGSITGLLGGNGAGKTTTIAMIMGLVTPTSGTRHACSAPTMPRQRYRVLHRMNFESPYVDMPMRLTVRQNLDGVRPALRRRGCRRRASPSSPTSST